MSLQANVKNAEKTNFAKDINVVFGFSFEQTSDDSGCSIELGLSYETNESQLLEEWIRYSRSLTKEQEDPIKFWISQ